MAQKPIAVFAADTHLVARGAWALRTIEGDSHYSLQQIGDFAQRWQVQGLYFAGDLIDAVMNVPTPITVLYRFIERMCKANIAFGYIVGQHDGHALHQWPDGHPHAQYLNATEFSVGPLKCYGLDHVPPPMTQTGLVTIPKGTNLAIGHQTFLESAGDLPSDCSLADVPSANWFFAGDWHRKLTAQGIGRDGQQIQLIVPGSTCMQAINEPPDKFFYVLTDDLQWKSVKLKTRRKLERLILCEADIQQFFTELDAILEQVLTETTGWDNCVRKPLLEVTYPWSLEKVKVRLEKAVAGRAHLFYKELPPEPAPEVLQRRVEAKARGDGRTATLESELSAYLARHGHPGLEAICRRLLETADASLLAELSSIRGERVNSATATALPAPEPLDVPATLEE